MALHHEVAQALFGDHGHEEFIDQRPVCGSAVHVGRADSLVLVSIDRRDVIGGSGVHVRAEGRGGGRVLRVARPGRFDALARAHARASRAGRHGTGSMGKQAADELVIGSNDEALELRRFAPSEGMIPWPFSEVWELTIDGSADALAAVGKPVNRVAAAVGIHSGEFIEGPARSRRTTTICRRRVETDPPLPVEF